MPTASPLRKPTDGNGSLRGECPVPFDHNDVTAEALSKAVGGRYSLEKEIGRGGMGVVFLAVDENLQRRVAIKTLPPHLASDEAVRTRFLHEARTAAALSHPGIVPIYSASEDNGVVYFVMRWIDGESLADRLAARGPMTSGEVLSLMAELASALGYAHSLGIVHRDVKAENVLIERKGGKALITDFGIARVSETRSVTATGTVLGTVQYMSPEQVTGDAVDGRSDLYALGVLGFHCITGRFPFERPTPSAVLVAHVNDAPPRLTWFASDVTPAAERIILRLLQKQPAARFASAELLCAAIEQARTDGRTPALGGTKVEVAELRDQPRTSQLFPDRLSSQAAEIIWARAAELQAGNTSRSDIPALKFPETLPQGEEAGVTERRREELHGKETESRPLRTPEEYGETDRGRPPVAGVPMAGGAQTVGYDVRVVREAAEEAGIDVRYVDRAIAEYTRQRGSAVRAGGSPASKKSWVLGAPAFIDFEGTIEGELSQEGFEQLTEEVRRHTGAMVQAGVIGRTLTITLLSPSRSMKSNESPYLQVSITSRNGTTTVRAMESLAATRAGVFAVGMVLSGYISILTPALTVGDSTPALVLPVFAGLLSGGFFLTRYINVWRTRKRARKLEELVSHLLDKAADFPER